MTGGLPAEAQLERALDFDDSLFATEEQNLFVDEVRETERWVGAGLVEAGEGDDEAVGELVRWVEGGLKGVLKVAGGREDGPLGWTADQHVFAVVARVVICAGVVEGTERGRGAGIGGLLEEWKGVAGGRRVHGALLEMVKSG